MPNPKVRVTLHGNGEAASEPLTIDEALEAVRAAWRQLRDTGQVKPGDTVEVTVEVKPRPLVRDCPKGCPGRMCLETDAYDPTGKTPELPTTPAQRYRCQDCSEVIDV